MFLCHARTVQYLLRAIQWRVTESGRKERFSPPPPPFPVICKHGIPDEIRISRVHSSQRALLENVIERFQNLVQNATCLHGRRVSFCLRPSIEKQRVRRTSCALPFIPTSSVRAPSASFSFLSTGFRFNGHGTPLLNLSCFSRLFRRYRDPGECRIRILRGGRTTRARSRGRGKRSFKQVRLNKSAGRCMQASKRVFNLNVSRPQIRNFHDLTAVFRLFSLPSRAFFPSLSLAPG